MTADPWGITQLKPSVGEEWFMNNSNFDGDSRVYTSESFSTQGDGFTRCGSSSFRASASVSTGFSDSACTQNQQTMVNRGYMQSSNDWKNVEFTIEAKVYNNANDHMTWGFRGARHTGSGGPRGCTGCNYKVSVEMNGNGVDLRKESWHVSYHDMGSWNVSGLNVDNAFRVKILCYNTNNNTNVTIECYVDTSAGNNFTKIFQATDTGNVNSDADECNCNNDGQPLVWGSPTILFRGDEGSYGFKNASIREIDPTGTGGGGSGGGGTGGSTWTPTNMYSVGDDGNVASNASDGDLGTRWSNYGNGSWITVDLGSAKEIDKVKISWYKGAERTNNFTISTSDDNSTFTTKFTGTSAGNTEAYEEYDINPNVTARYVRVTVTSNSQNEWASINDIQVVGPATGSGGGGSGGGDPPPELTADYMRWEYVYVLDYEEIGLCNPLGG